jgi:hypothetical protein
MKQFDLTERVSLQAAQMLVIAVRADNPAMREQLLDFAKRMAHHARAQAAGRNLQALEHQAQMFE